MVKMNKEAMRRVATLDITEHLFSTIATRRW
jgi:hypothetical protein